MPTVPQTVRALVDSLDIQHDRRQLVADTLQELGYVLDEQAGEALGAVTEAQLQHARGAKLNVREINALLVRLKAQGEEYSSFTGSRDSSDCSAYHIIARLQSSWLQPHSLFL